MGLLALHGLLGTTLRHAAAQAVELLRLLADGAAGAAEPDEEVADDRPLDALLLADLAAEQHSADQVHDGNEEEDAVENAGLAHRLGILTW